MRSREASRAGLLFGLQALIGSAWAVCPSDVPILDTLTCSSTVTGSITATDESQLGGDCDDGLCYTCGDPHADEPQFAPEDVYSFRCQVEGTVRMMITDLPCDLDIYVLDDSCDPNAGCLFGSTAPYAVDDEVTFTCTPLQMYYVVVEAYGVEHLDVASGPCTDDSGEIFDPAYSMSFDVSASTGCHEDCGDGIDNDLDGLYDCNDDDCMTDPICCDLDGDGYFSEACDGEDCNDWNAEISPGAYDEPGNGVDEDCDGADAEVECPVDTGSTDTGGDTGDDTGSDTDTDTDTDDGDTVGGDNEDTGGASGDLDSDDTRDKPGCGCAGVPAVGGSAAAVLVLTVLGWRRRDA